MRSPIVSGNRRGAVLLTSGEDVGIAALRTSVPVHPTHGLLTIV